MRENLIKKLMSASKCTVCGQHYRVDDVSVLGHEDNLWFLTVSCSVCQAQYLVAAIIQEESTREAVADLVEAVTADDLLKMHDFLTDFDGDFRRLFSQGGLE